MADPVPSVEAIRAVVQEVYENAVQRRAFDLQWAAEGRYEQYQETSYGRGPVPGGTDKDWADLRNNYHYRIVELFDSALTLGADPAGFDHTMQALQDAGGKLAGGTDKTLQAADVGDGKKLKDRSVSLTENSEFQGDVLNAENRVGNWHGDAADLFRKNFLDHLTPMKANQAVLFDCMRSTLAASQWVYGQYRRDLYEIANKAKAALHPAGVFAGASVGAALGLGYDLLKSTVGLVKTVGSPLSLDTAFTVIDFGMGIMSMVPKKSPSDQHTISGVDAEKAVETIGQLVWQVCTWLDDREKQLISVFDANTSGLTGSCRQYLVAPRSQETINLSAKSRADIEGHFY